MSVFSSDETLDDIAKEGTSDTQVKFRDGLKLLLSEVTRLRTKVTVDDIDTDDATDLVNHAAVILKTGRKVVSAHQPLELGSLSPSGRHQLGSGTSNNPEIDRITEQFKQELMMNQGTPDFNSKVARISAVLNGEPDSTVDLRRQLSDKQRELDGYRPFKSLKDAYDKVTDPAAQSRKLKSAEDAFNDVVKGSTASADPALTKAQTDLADAKKKLDDSTSLLKLFKSKVKHPLLSGSQTVRTNRIDFKETDLSDPQKNVWNALPTS